ncbi:MAG: hypothetical protein JWR87_2140 [Segetibacter sp.]|jgi:hypothetical protein|nr:hypothetical protein [Segetibacter sp.]
MRQMTKQAMWYKGVTQQWLILNQCLFNKTKNISSITKIISVNNLITIPLPIQ